MERSDIREGWCCFLGCSRISLALNAGYKPAFAGTTAALSRLPNVKPLDLAGRRQSEPEIRSEVAPRVRMKCADDIEPVVFDTLNCGEAFMAQRVIGELLQRTRAAVVVELCIW